MKNKLKVVRVSDDEIEFDDGTILFSSHEQDCCESHYLSMSDLELRDFDGLEFDITNDSFFKRIEGYGIELIPIKGFGVKIPGYASNNGYYSSELTLNLSNYKTFDITECQEDMSYIV